MTAVIIIFVTGIIFIITILWVGLKLGKRDESTDKLFWQIVKSLNEKAD